MSDIIHLLPDSVANQIAAGEVIQRPASVVKELVENAIDAGAHNIHVLITDAGKTSIQVIDDGKGMSETDARLAFERHATSKISNASDLFSLRTMGFRGEALASIAAVAEVELRTCLESEELGTRLVISGSKLKTQEVTSCSKGSNFLIKNLFFNVPARRKFLKANSTEMNHIMWEFERIALVNPEISFSLHNNDSEVMNLPSTQIRQRIVNVFGKRLNQQLLNVSVDTTMAHIEGYVAKPEASRKKGAHQFFFVNGRFMRHPYFHKAVTSAYQHLVPEGEQISYFLYFNLDPSTIDINIHPTKTEVKFENEQAIWQILSAAVKEALGKFSAIPSIDFDTVDMPSIPAYEEELPPAPPQVDYDSNFNPFQTSDAPSPSSRGGGYSSKQPDNEEWLNLYNGLTKASKLNAPDDVFEDEEPMPDQSVIQVPAFEEITKETIHASELNHHSDDCGSQYLQIKGRFILTSVKSGLMIIDQHRAHVRVLYERYINQITQKQGVSQGVLFPEVLELPASEAETLYSIMPDLTAVGFDISDLGSGSFAINAAPSGTEGLNPVDLVRDMVHTAIEEASDVKTKVQDILALTLAQSAAIVYGQSLSREEIVSLVDHLFACPSPNYTPDGKLILSTIKEEDINRLFK